MLKKLSLRARLTLLSACVMVSVAAALTAVSIFSADRFFVQDLQNEIATIKTSKNASVSVDAEEAKKLEDGDSPLDAESGDVAFSAVGETSPADAVGYATIQVSLVKAGRQFSLWGIAGLALVTVLGTAATWFMAGRALAPVRELSAAIGEMGDSNLSRRVEVQDRQDEIGQLARSFNAMMDKVSASFERQKRFSASAAHELRTPLATIQVGLEVLELDEHPSPARMEKALAVAKANTSRMIRLVDDLLRLSSAGEWEDQEEVPVRELLSSAAAELLPKAREKNVALSWEAPPDLSLTGSPAMLLRALANLGENAVKYNRDGGSVTLCAAAEEGDLVLRVSDTGIGIPPEEQAHIFEPFYRVDRSRSRAVGGSGLGLALVQDIAERHGGSVEVASTPGEGSVFTLRFPLPKEEGDPALGEPGESGAEEAPEAEGD